MGFLKELDVVNEMLGSLGEIGLNSLVGAPPLATKGTAILRRINAREQSKGWWFNKECIRLQPTTEGRIVIPDDVLKLDPVAANLPYVKRGKYLRNSKAVPGADPYVFDSYVDLYVTRLVPFDDLPMAAQDYISLSAQKDFVTDMDGDSLKISELKNDRREAYVVLMAEHIRSVDANLLQNPHTLSTLLSLRGNRIGSGLRHR